MTTPPIMPPRSRTERWFPIALILGCGALAYFGSFATPFFFDDLPSVVDNPTLRQVGSLAAALSPPPGGLTVSGRPVLNLSFALNTWLGGQSVWGFHAVNLAIHLLAGLTLFGLVRRTWIRGRGEPGATPFALVVALLWTLHPLQTESVTYIAQRAESLMGLFYLLTLYAFVRSAESIWAVLSITACLFGMATKEVMVSAPLIVLLYDRTFVSGTFAAAWNRRRPYYLALASTWLLLGYLLIRAGGSRGTSAGFGHGVTAIQYALTQCWAIVHYLRLALWPAPLVLDYGTVVMGLGSVWLQALLLIGLAVGTVTLFIGRAVPPYLGGTIAFLGCCFFAILAPSSSLVPVGVQTVAEHRFYLPLAAVLVVACAAIYRVAGKSFLFAGLALAVALGATTLVRNRDYRSRLAIWTDTVAKRPESARAQCNLGGVLCTLDRALEAIPHLERAVAIEPRYPDAHNNLGIALAAVGRRTEAIAQYREALRLDAGLVEAHFNLGLALAAAGRAEEAMAEYAKTSALRPGYAEADYNLGLVQAAQGRVDAARQSYQRALQAKPDYPEAENNLGNLLRDHGQAAEAVSHFRRAVALRPESGEFRYNLGNTQLGLGRWAEARENFERSLQLKPDNVGAHLNLARVLAQLGRSAEAASHYQAAIRLRPDLADAHNNLAVIWAEAGRLPEAVDEFLAAIRLDPADRGTHENLGRVYQALGRPAEAAAQFEIARRRPAAGVP